MTDLRKTLTARHRTLFGVLSFVAFAGCAAEPAPVDCWTRIHREARELRVTGSLSFEGWTEIIEMGRSPDVGRCERAREILDTAASQLRKASVRYRQECGESI